MRLARSSWRGRAVLLQAAQAGAQRAHGPVGALGVAAEPEQVVGGTARQIAGQPAHLRRLDGGPPQAVEGRQRGVADHPHIARFPVGRAQGHRHIGVDRHGQAPRQDGEAVGGRGHEHAHGIGFRHQPRRSQRRRGAEADLLLRHQRGPPDLDLLQQLGALGGAQPRRIDTGDGAARPGRALVRGTDHHVLEIGESVPAALRVAQPPPGPIRHQQLLAQHRLGELRQVGAQAAVLGQRRAGRVDHEVGLLAQCLQQTHRAGEARGVQLQRIRYAARHAAHDQVDRHQAVQRLERDAVAGDAQIAALHQQQAEVAGEIGVAEEVAVARPRRQQGNGGVGAVGAPGQCALQLLEERRQAHGVAGAENVAGNVGVHHAVGDGVADAGRRLRMRVDDAPAPVRAAREVAGEELDVAAGRFDAMAGAQEGGIAEYQLVRDGARRQQPLRAVQVRKDALEQPRPLDQGALELPPLPGRHHQRHQVDAPGLRRARRIGERIVRDAGFAHPRVELLGAQRAGGRAQRGELVQQRLPVRPEAAGRVDQLVEASGQGPIALGQAALR